MCQPHKKDDFSFIIIKLQKVPTLTKYCKLAPKKPFHFPWPEKYA